MATALKSDVAQHTDMMRRRIALDLEATYQWMGHILHIQTNSAAIIQAARETGLTPIPYAGQKIDYYWEIVIERGTSASKAAPRVEVFCDEQMVMIEAGEQQWFVFDLASGHGAGFCEVTGPEDAVSSYWTVITEVIKHWLQVPCLEVARNE